MGCHTLLQGLPDPGIEPVSLMSPALTGGFFTTSTTWEAHSVCSTAYMSIPNLPIYPFPSYALVTISPQL